VACGVNTAVKGVEVTMPHTHSNRHAVQAARLEFGEREHAPLARGELRDREIRGRGEFVSL
jgi:hypothetical protein